jgi:plasmid stabilization system protein ParE
VRMTTPFQFTPQAMEDLDGIRWFIADDSREAADRVETEIVAACYRLAKHPLMGTKRQDLTVRSIRFWTVTKFRFPYRTATTRSGTVSGR